MSRDLSPEFKAHVGVGNAGRSTLSNELKRILDSEVTVKTSTGPEKRTRAQLLAKVWYLKAMDGQFPFFKELMDRTEGKVPDRIAGADGGAVQADVIAATIARIYPREPKKLDVIDIELHEPPTVNTNEEAKDEDA